MLFMNRYLALMSRPAMRLSYAAMCDDGLRIYYYTILSERGNTSQALRDMQ